jgi:hypothetical protein
MDRLKRSDYFIPINKSETNELVRREKNEYILSMILFFSI